MESKVNIGLALSKDYQKVTCEFIEEIFEYGDEEELRAKIRKKFNFIKEEVDLEFTKINNGTN